MKGFRLNDFSFKLHRCLWEQGYFFSRIYLPRPNLQVPLFEKNDPGKRHLKYS